MTKACIPAALFGFVLLAASAAGAREARRVIVADPAACVQICPGDYAPCDPPYFKQADDRCNWDTKRRR